MFKPLSLFFPFWLWGAVFSVCCLLLFVVILGLVVLDLFLFFSFLCSGCRFFTSSSSFVPTSPGILREWLPSRRRVFFSGSSVRFLRRWGILRHFRKVLRFVHPGRWGCWEDVDNVTCFIILCLFFSLVSVFYALWDLYVFHYRVCINIYFFCSIINTIIIFVFAKAEFRYWYCILLKGVCPSCILQNSFWFDMNCLVLFLSTQFTL